MSSFPAASRSFRQTTLAIGLCLLALSFAMEAKLARYGLAARPASEVRATKALPDDAPGPVQPCDPSPDPANPQLPFAVLVALAVSCIAAADILLRRGILSSYLPASSLAHLSPQISFRPPPAS